MSSRRNWIKQQSINLHWVLYQPCSPKILPSKLFRTCQFAKKKKSWTWDRIKTHLRSRNLSYERAHQNFVAASSRKPLKETKGQKNPIQTHTSSLVPRPSLPAHSTWREISWPHRRWWCTLHHCAKSSDQEVNAWVLGWHTSILSSVTNYHTNFVNCLMFRSHLFSFYSTE